jgi:hypothetical protein
LNLPKGKLLGVEKSFLTLSGVRELGRNGNPPCFAAAWVMLGFKLCGACHALLVTDSDRITRQIVPSPSAMILYLLCREFFQVYHPVIRNERVAGSNPASGSINL